MSRLSSQTVVMDNQQAIEREKNINHAKSLLDSGKISEAKQFVMQVLQQSPFDHDLRELLRSTTNTTSKLDFPRFIQAFERMFMSAPNFSLQTAALAEYR